MVTLRRVHAPLLLLLAACGNPGTSFTVDERAAGAVAECEASTEALRVTGPNMLPGRICQNCHKPGGQAANNVWTASGTVFGSSTSMCNIGSVANAKVEIFKAAEIDIPGSQPQVTLMTNTAGNFFTKTNLVFPIRVRISKGTMTRTMSTNAPTGACASCHAPTGIAGGRIFLN